MSTTLIAGSIDTTGQQPYEQCGYCHEYDGNSKMPSYPRIAGQTSAYLIKQLRDFRSGKREGQMQATAELLNDEDIKSVAQYFSQQIVASVRHTNLSTSQRDMAKRLFFMGDSTRGLQSCAQCHGTKALGVGNIPRLAGQHEQYLQAQLISFKSGTRSNDARAEMQMISRILTHQEIKALVGFLARLTPQDKMVITGHSRPPINEKYQ